MKSFIVFLFLFYIVRGDLIYPDEKYIKNVKQLTFGGHHSLPSFSLDNSKIVFSARGGPYGMDCDQIYRINLNDLTEKPARVSPGLGYATNAKFFPGTYDVSFETNFHKVCLYLWYIKSSQNQSNKNRVHILADLSGFVLISWFPNKHSPSFWSHIGWGKRMIFRELVNYRTSFWRSYLFLIYIYFCFIIQIESGISQLRTERNWHPAL